MKSLTWRRQWRFVRPEALLLIHRLSGRSEPFRFAGVPVILRLPDVAPGRKAGYGRHELDLRQLLVFTGGRVEELLRVLDHASHGLLHNLPHSPSKDQLTGPPAQIALPAGGAGGNLKIFINVKIFHSKKLCLCLTCIEMLALSEAPSSLTSSSVESNVFRNSALFLDLSF